MVQAVMGMLLKRKIREKDRRMRTSKKRKQGRKGKMELGGASEECIAIVTKAVYV